MTQIRACILLPQHYEPDMIIFARLNILSHITNYGHQIHWIMSSSRDYIPFHMANGVKVHTVTYPISNNLLVMTIRKASYTIRKLRLASKLVKEEKLNLCIARNDLFDALIAIYIQKRYKLPFAFELINPLGQTLEDQGLVTPFPKSIRHLIIKLRHTLEKWTSMQADLFLPASNELAAQASFCKKVKIIPSGVDTTLFSRHTGKRKSKLLIYVGTLDKMRQLDILIKTLAIIKRTERQIELLVVGDGSGRLQMEALATELGIANSITFTGKVSQDEIPKLIATASIGLSPVPPAPFYIGSTPIKVAEYMAMSKPVIANVEIPNHREVLLKSKSGVLVNFTPESFAEAIIWLLRNPKEAKEMSKRGRLWVEQNRSYDILARQFEEEFRNVIIDKIAAKYSKEFEKEARWDIFHD